MLVVNVSFSFGEVELALSVRFGTVEVNVFGNSVVVKLNESAKYGISGLTVCSIVFQDGLVGPTAKFA